MVLNTAMNSTAIPMSLARAKPLLTRRVFIRDLVLDCQIGIHRHEQGRPQRVRFNIDVVVEAGADRHDHRIASVVCYEKLVRGIEAIVAEGHINLVETLAERVADLCLADSRALEARVRIEKLDVFDHTESVGVEIERQPA